MAKKRFNLPQISDLASCKPKKDKKAVDYGEAQSSMKSSMKRKGAGTSKKAHAKRAKKDSKKISEEDDTVMVEESSKKHVQRLWSEEDELALLQGLIDSKTDTGKKEGFYESLKDSISFDVRRDQFIEKIRKLKIKYVGKKKYFSNAHEKKCFDLSMHIWGPNGFAVESTEKSKNMQTLKEPLLFSSPNGKTGDDTSYRVDVEEEESPLGSDFNYKSYIARWVKSVGGDEDSVEMAWSLMPMETRKEMEKKCNVVQAKEFDFLTDKVDLLRLVFSATRQVFSTMTESS
ncbi:hypothetical protein AALP_AA2G067400 [Arabis alpina]|uniref:Uncharacterized protein n=1 Tax=Arabis alpina TaxID=50452 RepID=A0A087HFR3_ARAAL|nr:hypothetical protein AALP_AA2G067400 [Arabis alpina]